MPAPLGPQDGARDPCGEACRDVAREVAREGTGERRRLRWLPARAPFAARSERVTLNGPEALHFGSSQGPAPEPGPDPPRGDGMHGKGRGARQGRWRPQEGAARKEDTG